MKFYNREDELNKNKLILKSQKLLEKYSTYTVKYMLLSIDDIQNIIRLVK
jgi:hypothetical protein